MGGVQGVGLDTEVGGERAATLGATFPTGVAIAPPGVGLRRLGLRRLGLRRRGLRRRVVLGQDRAAANRPAPRAADAPTATIFVLIDMVRSSSTWCSCRRPG
ncbi:MAG: hypothetical protein U5R31_06385 [Acidimicrobiia bacterium]|nr:hypothetical protein [Acidimicrobiia bacterium]